MPENKNLERPILLDPLDSSGHFALPQSFTPEDEVRWAKKRIDSTRVAQYADSRCGLSNTFDPDGGYLCGGRADGLSRPCNKLVGAECLIRIKPINKPHLQSCGFWETQNAGDPEARYCPKGKLDDARISFGGTKNKLGFSCQRCEYGQQKLPRPDSEGRTLWCGLKGHPVEPDACCADNEPFEGEGEESSGATIYFVHHGQTQFDVEGKVQGNLESPLTDIGRREAMDAAQRLLALTDCSQVISSPLLRARQTAEIISNENFAPIAYDKGLLPWDEGNWSGRKHSEVFEDMKWYAKNPSQIVPNGESFQSYVMRLGKFLQNIRRALDANPKWTPVLVTHSMNIVTAAKLLNNQGGDLLGTDSIPNGGVVAFHLEGGKFRREAISTKEAHNA